MAAANNHNSNHIYNNNYKYDVLTNIEDELIVDAHWKDNIIPILSNELKIPKASLYQNMRLMNRLPTSLCVRVINRETPFCIDPASILQSKLLGHYYIYGYESSHDNILIVPHCHIVVTLVQLASAYINVYNYLHDLTIKIQDQGLPKWQYQNAKECRNRYITMIKRIMVHVQQLLGNNLISSSIDWNNYTTSEYWIDDLYKWAKSVVIDNKDEQIVIKKIPNWYNGDVICIKEPEIKFIDYYSAFYNLLRSFENNTEINLNDIYSLKKGLFMSSTPLFWMLNKENYEYTLKISNIKIHSVYVNKSKTILCMNKEILFPNIDVEVEVDVNIEENHNNEDVCVIPSINDILRYLDKHEDVNYWISYTPPFKNIGTYKEMFSFTYDKNNANITDIIQQHEETHTLPSVRTILLKHELGLLLIDVNWYVEPLTKEVNSCCVIQ